jgi:hypothetical protein
MKKLIFAGLIALGALYASGEASQAASRNGGERYDANARAECILPWYRFVGACDEAIDDHPYGSKSHDWSNRHYRGRHHW